MCTDDVKCSLFRTYVTPLYTAQLWSNYSKGSMRRLKVAYNDALRLLLHVPRWHIDSDLYVIHSASGLFVNNGLPTLEALLRHLVYGFICRLDQLQNSLIEALASPVRSSYRYTSRLRLHWRNCLYANSCTDSWSHWILLCIFISYVFFILLCVFILLTMEPWCPK